MISIGMKASRHEIDCMVDLVSEIWINQKISINSDLIQLQNNIQSMEQVTKSVILANILSMMKNTLTSKKSKTY